MRWLIILGVVCIIAGIGLTFFTVGSSITQSFTQGSELTADIDARAEALCTEGETLDVVEGPSTRNSSGTYGRSQVYYCVDANGTRRDVTGDFVTGIFSDIPGFLSSIPGFNTGLLGGVGTMALSCLGAVLIFVGVIGGILRGSARTRTAYAQQGVWGAAGSPISGGTYTSTSYSSNMPAGMNVTRGQDGSVRIDMGGMSVSTPPVQTTSSPYGFDFPGADQPVVTTASSTFVVGGSGDVMPIQDMNEVAELMNLMQLPVNEVVRRMNQLEEDRRAGRVSEAQYNRMREIMLRALKRG